jgi:hypothetical protein
VEVGSGVFVAVAVGVKVNEGVLVNPVVEVGVAV